MLLFVARLKRCRSLRSDDEPLIDAGDIKRAEAAWIISVEQNCYQEIQYLLNHKGACPILVHQFDLFIDDRQLMRCQGRISNSPELSFGSKKPALLPTKHAFVTLLIQQSHEHCKHGGVNETLTLLRERNWIL